VSRLKAKDPKAAEPSKPKVLIFGKSGVGKTWQALDFPRVYYIDTEGGADLDHYTDKLAKAHGVYMGPSDGACDFSVVIDQMKALATERHEYRTVVIDSISKLFNSAVAMEAERLGDKNAFGADKKPAIAAMRQLVSWLQRLDMNVILIAHEKAEWGQNAQGERVEIGATFDCWEKLEYELHLALRIIKQAKTRKAFIRKTRLLGFPEGESFAWTYDEFATRYGRAIIEGEVKTIVLATADQITEVQRLLQTVRVDSDFSEKCFARAGAQAWGELDNDQITKVIEFLKGRIAA
jgi:adenosyl cobinamide kinase/adenosyl cobinamide phosphate guanylyltransferase